MISLAQKNCADISSFLGISAVVHVGFITEKATGHAFQGKVGFFRRGYLENGLRLNHTKLILMSNAIHT
ncbi:hypothetical protein C8I07_14200 [Shewanella baltica]|nr:hypothetical protein C8I07_14200 [Shewanella baltica]